MMKKYLILSLLALAIPSAPLVAQQVQPPVMEPVPPKMPETRPAKPWKDTRTPEEIAEEKALIAKMRKEKALFDKIMFADTAQIRIAKSDRSDLSSCDGRTLEQIWTAINTCWPVLKAYRKSQDMRDKIMTYSEYGRQSKTKPPKSMRDMVLKSIDKTVPKLMKRTWPAEDLPLMIAIFIRAEFDEEVGNYADALSRYDLLVELTEESRIDNDDLKKTASLKYDRKRLRSKIAEQNETAE